MPVSATKEERDKSEAVFCGNEVRASVSLQSLDFEQTSSE